jgi:hypothetical protein
MILNIKYRKLKNGRTHRLSEKETRLLLMLADNEKHRYTELQKFIGAKNTKNVNVIKCILCRKVPELKIRFLYDSSYICKNEILIDY